MQKRIFLSLFSLWLLLPVLVFAQTPRPSNEGEDVSIDQLDMSSLPDAPAFLKDVKTEEQYKALTDVQKEEAEAFLSKGVFGPGMLAKKDVGTLPNTVSCFDYYQFGSVQVNLDHTTGSSVTGSLATFSGTIKNDNEYPIVDGSVYVKIFRFPGSGETPVQGYDVVDQFFVKEDIQLPAKGEVPLSFDWNVPAYLVSGQYQAAFFYTSAKKFNLLGLSFTDDVVGNTSTFTVSSEIQKRIFFEKNQVTVDGNKYFFAAFTPKVSADKPITVSATLVNETNTDETLPIVWKVYRWDAQREDNLVNMTTNTVTVPKNGTVTSTHTVTDVASSVYLVVAEVQHKDTTSILNVRFTREGISITRINFPALTSYPLVANQEATLFSCLHGAGTLDLVEGGKLVLTLTDKRGRSIHSYTYEGGVTGAMMAVKDSFTPKENYDTFTLKAELYKDNQLVDSVEMHYDCNALNKGICQKDSTTNLFEMGSSGENTTVRIGVFVLLILLLALSISVILAMRRRRNGKKFLSVFFFGILFSSFGIFGVEQSYAASVTSNVVYDGQLNYCWTGDQNLSRCLITSGPFLTGWLLGLDDPNVSVTYHAELRNVATQELIQLGSAVPVGTVFDIEDGPYQKSDISWFGTGYTEDSPYGDWSLKAEKVGSVCTENNFLNRDSLIYSFYGGPYNVYGQYSVSFPEVGYATSGTAGLSCSGRRCTVTSPGTIGINVHFSSVPSKFYYGYGTPSSCRENSYANRETLNEFVGWAGYTYAEVPPHDYVMDIPVASIQFNFTAVGSNTAPNAPTIHGSGGVTGQSLLFTFQATDSDEDQVKYGIDWCINHLGQNSCDDVVDQWVPASGFVNSGFSAEANHAWTTSGRKTFQALTQDARGANSGWASHTVEIGASWANLEIKVSHSEWRDVSSVETLKTDTLYFAWTSSLPYVTNCRLMGYGISEATGISRPRSAPVIVDPPIQTSIYTLTCIDVSGASVTDEIAVNVACSPGPIGLWSDCTPPCDSDGIGSRTRRMQRADCTEYEKREPCPVPRCAPDGFKEVLP